MPDNKLLAFPGDTEVQVIETRVRDCSIDSVVVYKDRAEVKRVAPVHLCAGENEVIVSDLPECVDKNSIRYLSFFICNSLVTVSILFS